MPLSLLSRVRSRLFVSASRSAAAIAFASDWLGSVPGALRSLGSEVRAEARKAWEVVAERPGRAALFLVFWVFCFWAVEREDVVAWEVSEVVRWEGERAGSAFSEDLLHRAGGELPAPGAWLVLAGDPKFAERAELFGLRPVKIFKARDTGGLWRARVWFSGTAEGIPAGSVWLGVPSAVPFLLSFLGAAVLLTLSWALIKLLESTFEYPASGIPGTGGSFVARRVLDSLAEGVFLVAVCFSVVALLQSERTWSWDSGRIAAWEASKEGSAVGSLASEAFGRQTLSVEGAVLSTGSREFAERMELAGAGIPRRSEARPWLASFRGGPLMPWFDPSVPREFRPFDEVGGSWVVGLFGYAAARLALWLLGRLVESALRFARAGTREAEESGAARELRARLEERAIEGLSAPGPSSSRVRPGL